MNKSRLCLLLNQPYRKCFGFCFIQYFSSFTIRYRSFWCLSGVCNIFHSYWEAFAVESKYVFDRFLVGHIPTHTHIHFLFQERCTHHKFEIVLHQKKSEQHIIIIPSWPDFECVQLLLDSSSENLWSFLNDIQTGMLFN
jgi:hypothetical protein